MNTTPQSCIQAEVVVPFVYRHPLPQVRVPASHTQLRAPQSTIKPPTSIAGKYRHPSHHHFHHHSNTDQVLSSDWVTPNKMASLTPPLSPYPSLPKSPRANREMLYLIDTRSSRSNCSCNCNCHSTTSSPISERTLHPAAAYLDPRKRHDDSLIFADAIIPTSPASSTSSGIAKETFELGVPIRKRSGFARLFSCFGREQRARRKAERENTAYEKAGVEVHWTEL